MAGITTPASGISLRLYHLRIRSCCLENAARGQVASPMHIFCRRDHTCPGQQLAHCIGCLDLTVGAFLGERFASEYASSLCSSHSGLGQHFDRRTDHTRLPLLVLTNSTHKRAKNARISWPPGRHHGRPFSRYAFDLARNPTNLKCLVGVLKVESNTLNRPFRLHIKRVQDGCHGFVRLMAIDTGMPESIQTQVLPGVTLADGCLPNEIGGRLH